MEIPSKIKKSQGSGGQPPAARTFSFFVLSVHGPLHPSSFHFVAKTKYVVPLCTFQSQKRATTTAKQCHCLYRRISTY